MNALIQVAQIEPFTHLRTRHAEWPAETALYQLSKLARYPVEPLQLHLDHRLSLFNINAELYNPHFAMRFWAHCERLTEDPGLVVRSGLRLELVSVFAASDCDAQPVQHLVSAWTHSAPRPLSVAGGLFTSDLSVYLGLPSPESSKVALVKATLEPLFAVNGADDSIYDVLVIGFPMPRGMRRARVSRSAFPMVESPKGWRIYDVEEPLLTGLLEDSLTVKIFVKRVRAHVRLFVIETFKHTRGAALFTVFVMSSLDQPLDFCCDERFWDGALVPLIADHLRMEELQRLPGQASRVQERRLIGKAAARAAWERWSRALSSHTTK